MGFQHLVQRFILSWIASFTLTALPAQAIPIGEVQGIGSQSPLQGATVSLTGIVTATYLENDQLEGFFLQDRGDGNELTSDAVFVFCPHCQTIEVGDSLLLRGDVEEFFDLTEITKVGLIEVLAKQKVLPPARPIISNHDLEKYECMRIQIPSGLELTNTSDLQQFGQISFSTIPQLQPTDLIDPNDSDPSGTRSQGATNSAALDSLTQLQIGKVFILDDGSEDTFPDLYALTPLFRELRLGSMLDSLVGVLNYSFGSWQLLSSEAWENIKPAPRPTLSALRSNLRIVSLNAGNHFNGNGRGSAFLDSRGPANQQEFVLQQAKIIAAIDSISPAICGLQEIENDGFGSLSTAQQLIDVLNQRNPIRYDVIEYDNVSDDQIQNVFIYDTEIIAPLRELRMYGDRVVAQDFIFNVTGDVITVILVHLKSKSCANANGDDKDLGDGQGCFNAERKRQIEELLSQVSIDSAPNVLVMGDFNAYRQEDPIDLMRDKGWQDIFTQHSTFLFGGMQGALDHMMVSAGLLDHIHGMQIWDINVSQPALLRYNNPEYAEEDAYACSDHNPLIVDLGFIVTNHKQWTGRLAAIYPNPTRQEVCMKIPDGAGRLTVSLVSDLGQMVEHWMVNPTHSAPCHQLPDLPSGVYLLKIETREQMQVQQLVIK